MNTGCDDVRAELGALLDGELGGSAREAVEQHLAECDGCPQELAELRALAQRLAGRTDVAAPAGLWPAIEKRLERAAAPAAGPAPTSAARSWVSRIAARPLAAAAGLALVVGLGWLALNAPWASRATAAEIDFRPLLERANGDIGAAIQALMATYGGQPISASEAQRRVNVRVKAPDDLPGGLRLAGRYMLNMGGHHQALALHYVTARQGHLLLLQCPPDVVKNYGNYECPACSITGHDDRGLQVGKLHLMHMASSNVCVCIVSTLDRPTLEKALAAVQIDF